MSTPEELEYLAEREKIGVVPNINLDETLLIEEKLLPFRFDSFDTRQCRQCQLHHYMSTVIVPNTLRILVISSLS